jgi:hypothetical protein
MSYLWLMNLQISQGEYTLFSAHTFVGLRACIESLWAGQKFRFRKSKVKIYRRLNLAEHPKISCFSDYVTQSKNLDN